MSSSILKACDFCGLGWIWAKCRCWPGARPDFGCSSGDGLAAEARFNDPDQFFLACLRGRGVQDDLARVQEVNAIAHLEDLVIVMHNQNDRDAALAPQILDQAQNMGALPHAKSSQRLIQN